MGLTFEERQAHRCRCRKAEEAYCAIAEANLHLKLARQQAAFEAEEENRKWANEHWDEVEAYEQRKLIPKEY